MSDNKPLSKEEIREKHLSKNGLAVNRSDVGMRIQKAAYDAMDEYSEQVFRFAEWASHSDWTYLPNKKKWHNEEDEENITPKTTLELYTLYLQQKQQP